MLTSVLGVITGIATIIGAIMYLVKKIVPTQSERDNSIEADTQTAEDAFKKTGAPK